MFRFMLLGRIFRSVCIVLLAGAVIPTASAASTKPEKNTGKAATRKHKTRPMTERQRAQHALNRLTFGARPGDLQRVLALGTDKWIEQQLQPAAIDDHALEARLAPLRTLRMTSRDMLENFPAPPLIRAVAEGKRPLPTDPATRLVYQVQVAKYRQDQDVKQQAAKSATDGQMVPAAATSNTLPAPPLPDQSDAARRAALTIAGLPRDKRFAAMGEMPSGDLLALQYLKPEDRDRLGASLSPEEREVFAALANPAGVIVGEAVQGKVLRAIYSERQFDEVITDFWFNHFNVFIGKDQDRYLVTSYERDVIRPRALGKFKDLLLAVAEHPAMQIYLDNWLSAGPHSPLAMQAARRTPPPGKTLSPPPGLNENYARELMELHTLGVNGGYTQADVTEVARVFTGWTVGPPDQGAQFMFDPRKHEPGDKTVLGAVIHENGQQEGLDVLATLASHASTARFLCTKLARRFVSDDPPPALVDHMTQTWAATDGDIREVLRTMFRSPEFWSGEAYRAKVKTPLEFVASAVRATGADVNNATPLAQSLNRMGMPLYGMQAPTGYKNDAATWLSSDALLDRMNFALTFSNSKIGGTRFDASHVLAASIFAGAMPALTHKATHNPATGQDAALAMIEAALLADDISPQTEQTIRKQLQDPKITGDALADPTRPLNLMTALVLGSPEFQKR